VLVYRAHAEEPITALVNPAIEWRSDELEVAEEGCLSIPGAHVEVERPARIRARARDASGEELMIEAEGLEARVIQHEVDHLDGILFLDRVTDPTTFSTWEQFDRHRREEFLRRVAPYTRDGGA
jgi:peptide deformylase